METKGRKFMQIEGNEPKMVDKEQGVSHVIGSGRSRRSRSLSYVLA